MTANKVTTLQAFRDLCGNQVLREGGDAVLSDSLANDPAVKSLSQGLPLESGAAQMKGFDEPVAYTRLCSPA